MAKVPPPPDPADKSAETPALADVIERNIRTVARQHLEARQNRGVSERIADAITTFSGRMPFVYLHVAWFALWILANTGHLGVPAFDPFPYGLLTMIVSLEAIFLSTFVLISQNRLSEDADRRAHLDLQIGLLTEHELTRALQMLDAVQDKLGIENDADTELAQLEMETRPEDVLAEIQRVARQVRANPKRPRPTARG
ncbi:MAG: DUF1003 domain-containing protein [Acidobacteria bacterium]|nr:DUF1003 domain-containing protein [Acidobacteriota bacterium]MCA1612250.1 DUF1003 domain-containing protein [Acidobacteriota bacterium]